MKEPTVHVVGPAWLQVIPAILIVALAIALWRPALEATVPTPTPQEELTIRELAARFGAEPLSADDIERGVRSFGPFPPDPTAARAFAEALITCGTASLDEAQRVQLARQLYAITVQRDVTADAMARALAAIEQTMLTRQCGTVTMDGLMGAARGMARSDPNPRRNWW